MEVIFCFAQAFGPGPGPARPVIVIGSIKKLTKLCRSNKIGARCMTIGVCMCQLSTSHGGSWDRWGVTSWEWEYVCDNLLLHICVSELQGMGKKWETAKAVRELTLFVLTWSYHFYDRQRNQISEGVHAESGERWEEEGGGQAIAFSVLAQIWCEDKFAFRAEP